MPSIILECKYCGKVFSKYLYSLDDMDNNSCIVCGDTHVKVRQVDTDQFGYNSNKAKKDAYIKK